MTRGLVCPCISYRSQGLVFDDPGNIITMSNKNYMVADWILKSRREAVVSAPLHRGGYTESTGREYHSLHPAALCEGSVIKRPQL